MHPPPPAASRYRGCVDEDRRRPATCRGVDVEVGDRPDRPRPERHDEDPRRWVGDGVGTEIDQVHRRSLAPDLERRLDLAAASRRRAPPQRSPRTIAAVPVAAMVRQRLPPGRRIRISSGSRGREGRSAEPIAQPDTRRAGEPAAEPPRVELVRLAPSRQRNGFEPGAKREDCCRVRITPVASEHVAEDVVHVAQPQPLRTGDRTPPFVPVPVDHAPRSNPALG